MPSERIQRQINRLLDETEEAISNQEWDLVGERARSVLRLDPDNQDALSYLAAAERDVTPAAGAVCRLRQFLRLMPLAPDWSSISPRNSWPNWKAHAALAPHPVNAGS